MKADSFINSPVNWIKWLPFLLLLAAGPAVFQVDYPMIFHLKATIMSWASVIICCIGLIINLKIIISPNKSVAATAPDKMELITGYSPNKNAFTYIWFGVTLYTLNFWLILISALFLAGFIQKADKNAEETGRLPIDPSIIPLPLPSLKDLVVQLKEAFPSPIFRDQTLNWVLVSVSYLYIDVLREYSVWHELSFRLVPMVVFVMALALSLKKIIDYRLQIKNYKL